MRRKVEITTNVGQVACNTDPDAVKKAQIEAAYAQHEEDMRQKQRRVARGIQKAIGAEERQGISKNS